MVAVFFFLSLSGGFNLMCDWLVVELSFKFQPQKSRQTRFIVTCFKRCYQFVVPTNMYVTSVTLYNRVGAEIQYFIQFFWSASFFGECIFPDTCFEKLVYQKHYNLTNREDGVRFGGMNAACCHDYRFWDRVYMVQRIGYFTCRTI